MSLIKAEGERMKLTKEQREIAKKHCREYAEKFFSVGSIATAGLCRLSGSSCVRIKQILNCGAIIVDFLNGMEKEFRFNPFLGGCLDNSGNLNRNEEPFWSKDSYNLGVFEGYTEEYDDTCETRPVGIRASAEYKGHNVRLAICQYDEQTIQTNVRISRHSQNDLKLPPFFNKTRDEVLAECRKVIDKLEISLFEAIQNGSKMQIAELEKKAENGEIIRIM